MAPPIPTAADKPDAGMKAQQVLFKKGAATALAFKPSTWSYEATTETEGPQPSPTSVLMKQGEVARAPSTTLPAQKPDSAAASTPVPGVARKVEDRAAQRALAEGLAEIIDGILCTRQFATRGIHESFRKRPVTPTPQVEQPATAEDVASALRAELARAKVDPDTEPRLTRPMVDLVLRFIGLRECTDEVVSSDPAPDHWNLP